MFRHISFTRLKEEVAAGRRMLHELEFRRHLVRTVEVNEMIVQHTRTALMQRLLREQLQASEELQIAA